MAGTQFTRPEGIGRLNMVAEYLTENGVCTPEQIGALLRIATASAMAYLRFLRDDGRAHKICQIPALWAPGPDQAWLDAEKTIALEDTPAQVTVACCQTGRARRDPLVEALFGPARPASNDSSNLAQA